MRVTYGCSMVRFAFKGLFMGLFTVLFTGQSGVILPAAYLVTPDFPSSPVYNYGGGIAVVMVGAKPY